MSALDRLPDNVRQEALRKKPGMREDLVVIKEAEAAGWAVEFGERHWHNPATFSRAGAVVWLTSKGWRLKSSSKATPITMESLRKALDLEETNT